MNDFSTSNGLLPTIALLTSDGVEEAARRNNLSFTDLLTPFCTAHQININDPNGQQNSLKLQIALRDIRRNGYLLSLTVLPSVLQETVRLITKNNQSDDAWSGGFKELFSYWQEPSGHDFLKTYVCCIFAVSVSDSDPIATLSNLIQQQNYQQHGSGESANSLSAAHCSAPKWFLPQILKYYVLVQDNLKDDNEKAQTIFSTISSTYGQQFCYHLKINSAENANMPDPWSKTLADRYCGLENGLEVARREILIKNQSTTHAATHELANLSISSITTVSSDISINTLAVNLDNNVPKRVSPSNNTSNAFNSKRGDCLDTDDRERIRTFIEHLVKTALVPFVERQLVTQNEALMNRRGIGKSFTNMKKWLNVASSVTPQSSSNSTSVNYANESPEMQTRRLADLAFLFGLYSYSLQLYQTLKKDFLNDQAWLHHAGALEMAALSSFLSSNTPQQLKNYPARYMENAIEFYANTCSQPLLAIRCILYSAEILTHLEKYTDAANQIIRVTSSLPDIYGSVFLERAATLFGRGKLFRRQAFHFVLAGHRYEKTHLNELAFQCYKKALPEYMDKQWTNAEDNVLCVVSRDPGFRLEDRIECSQRLVRPYCLNQSEEQQEVFLKNYLRQTSDGNRSLAVPIITNVETFYGANPTSLNNDDLTKQDFKFTPDCLDVIPEPNWTDIERSAYIALFGSSAIFKPFNSFANDLTNNEQVNVTPANEPFTIRLRLVNPLKIGLKLRRLRLDFSEIESLPDTQPFSHLSEIDELYLPGMNLIEATSLSSDALFSMEAQTIHVDLSCTPTTACKTFTANSLKFDIIIGDSSEVFCAHIPIDTHGRRLFKTKVEMSGIMYAPDNRLKANVNTQPYPSLSFQFSNHLISQNSLEIQTTSLNLFCSQTYQLNLQITNNGNCDVDRLSVGYDRPELLTFYDTKMDTQFKVNTNISCPGTFTSSLISQSIKAGETINLQLIIHAPSQPVNNSPLRLVFLYASTDGVSRQWRHNIDLTTTQLIQCEICVLDFDDRLCALKARNMINARDSILVQIECLRLEAKLKTSSGYFVDLHPLSNRKIILDTDQSDLYCFYVRFTSGSSRSIVMSDDKSKRYWPHLSELQTDHLQFALTWRAKITRDTTSSIHGQSIISNPFIQFPSDELSSLMETAIPSMLIQTRLLRQLVSIPANKDDVLLFSLTADECRQKASANCSNNEKPSGETKIPWSIDL